MELGQVGYDGPLSLDATKEYLEQAPLNWRLARQHVISRLSGPEADVHQWLQRLDLAARLVGCTMSVLEGETATETIVIGTGHDLIYFYRVLVGLQANGH